MRHRRLIITSFISVVLVFVLLIGSTYSIFTSSDIDENMNVYTTGILDVTYTISEDNVAFTESLPISVEDSLKLQPYRITVTNNGNVPYQFDVILEDTTAGEVIDYQYIMVQVGKLEAKDLSSCTDNIIKESVIVAANSSVDIDVRVWISDTIQNSEIGKSFYGRLSIDGLAVYTSNSDIDNSVLIAETGIETYRISVNTVTGGVIHAAESAEYGDTVTITTNPSSNFTYYGATIVDSSGVTLMTLDSSQTTFTMPACDVVVKPKWKYNDLIIIKAHTQEGLGIGSFFSGMYESGGGYGSWDYLTDNNEQFIMLIADGLVRLEVLTMSEIDMTHYAMLSASAAVVSTEVTGQKAMVAIGLSSDPSQFTYYSTAQVVADVKELTNDGGQTYTSFQIDVTNYTGSYYIAMQMLNYVGNNLMTWIPDMSLYGRIYQ